MLGHLDLGDDSPPHVVPETAGVPDAEGVRPWGVGLSPRDPGGQETRKGDPGTRGAPQKEPRRLGCFPQGTQAAGRSLKRHPDIQETRKGDPGIQGTP